MHRWSIRVLLVVFGAWLVIAAFSFLIVKLF
jgi:hypothetical protein